MNAGPMITPTCLQIMRVAIEDVLSLSFVVFATVAKRVACAPTPIPETIREAMTTRGDVAKV